MLQACLLQAGDNPVEAQSFNPLGLGVVTVQGMAR